MSKEFLDWTATQGSGAGLEVLGNALRKAISFDAYGGKKQFKARALTNAYPLNDAEGALFLETDYNASPNTGSAGEPAAANAPIGYSQYIFKARIIGKNSPHSFIPDPCDDAFIADPEKAIPYVMMHTSFVTDINATTDDFQYIKKGDIVIVELEENEFSYNLQFGKFVKIANTRVQNITERTPEACASLEGLFSNASGLNLVGGRPGEAVTEDPGTFYWSNRKRQLTARWTHNDGEHDWAGKTLQNGEIANIPGLLVEDPASGATLLKPAMDDWLQLTAAYKAKFGKQLKASGYRTYSSQVAVRLKRVPGDRCPTRHGGSQGDGSGNQQYNSACEHIGYAAVPGNSNHGWAAAADLRGSQFRMSPRGTAPNNEEFKWVNKYASRFNFVFGVTNEHWHLDWNQLSQYTTLNSPHPQKVAWDTTGQSENIPFGRTG